MTAQAAAGLALDLPEGRLLLTGPPGSGKTWTLRERYARLVSGGADPERIALLVLNRRAARDARDDIVRRLGRSLGGLPVFTAHSLAFSTLGRRFADLGYAEPPAVLSAAEQYAVVRELLHGEPRAAWPRFGHLLGVPGFAREVADFVLRAQERLLDPKALGEVVASAGREDWSELVAFYGRYLDVQGQANRVDFAGLLHECTALLQRRVDDEDLFEHLLVDDYQDITPATETIVHALAQRATSVVIAADPGGNVFSYRGGSVEPLRRVREALAPIGEATLPGGERIGAEALAALDDPEVPPVAADGRIEAREFAHPGEEADAIAHELLRRRVDEGVPWEQMAVVLRRYGEYLTALRHALARHGVPFVVVGEEASVATEAPNRAIIGLLRYAFRPKLRGDLLEPLLQSPVVGLDPHELRRLRREARRREVPLAQLVEREDLSGLPDPIREPVEGLRTLVADLERDRTARPDAVFFRLWSRLPHVRVLVAEERHRDLDALSALGDILARFAERRRGASIDDYLDTLEAAEFGPDPWVPPEERHPHAVRIASAHRVHGASYEVVLVAGCVEGEFPSLARTSRLVDLERLLVQATAAERLKSVLAEERRLFRLAVTRARRATMLFASRSASATRPRTPSRFASRLGVTWSRAEEPPASATSLRELEGELRRTIADPAHAAPARIAALAALGASGADPRAWWGGRDWTDPGDKLYAEELRTSYSRLSTMENCALQYLYQVEMGLDPDQTFQMWLGAIVHEVIDRVQRGEIQREEGPVLAELEARWDSRQFPSRAIEHRKRLDAQQMLVAWINGEKTDVLASEVGFTYPLGDAIIRGKIDAIFRMDNGGLRLVDYKTGRYPPTEEQLKSDLQLGAYYLALQRDEGLRKLGRRTGYLMLAYIGSPRGEGYARPGFAPPTGYEEWAESTITELIGRVRTETFAPNPAADCQWCSFKSICPMWPEGEEAAR